MDENKFFIKIIEDRFRRFQDRYVIMNSDFLSLEQQSMLSGFLRSHGRDGVLLFGGYEDAERKQIFFMPDYTQVVNEEELAAYFSENPDDCPLAVLNVNVPPAERGKLGHRDYLGALMGEGIKREKLGDIIVTEDGAQIIAIREMAEYLARNFLHAGRVSVKTEVVPINEIRVCEIRKKIDKFTISSPRIDNIVAAVFGVSRKAATEAILRGKVFVNGIEIIKPDFSLKGGEKVVLRGKGKAIYLGEQGTSRKGKTYIKVESYI